MENFVGSKAIPKVEYHRPRELEAALTLIGDLGDKCRIIAGGTDLIPALRRGALSSPFKHLVDLSAIGDLDYIQKEEGWIHIGAVTRLADVGDSKTVREYAPVLSEAIQHIGSLQIRNQGTLGGNLANASPAADTAPPLLVLGAMVLSKSRDKERVIPLDQFFLGPGKTLLTPDEILTEIQIPIPQDQGKACFLKLGRRNAFTLSVVSVAAWVKTEKEKLMDIRIALGAVAPTPMRATGTEEYLKGKKVSEETITDGAKIVRDEVQPISDVRASADYRKDMAYVLTRRAILSCAIPK